MGTESRSLVGADLDRLQSRSVEITKALVRFRSITRTPGERDFAHFLEQQLRSLGGDALEYGQYPLSNDPLGRTLPWAFLGGHGERTVVLMSHFDTVDVADYGQLTAIATEPVDLEAGLRRGELALDAGAHRDLNAPGDWIFGRGSVDMKSGIAAHMAALECLIERARMGDELPGNVLFISAPDEETESAGILAAVKLLGHIARERGLTYVGAINTDYTSPLHEADTFRAIYAGTVGKLLPSVYVRGCETHAGEPYHGVDADLLVAEVVRSVSMRADFADSVDGDVAAPPVALKTTDFKQGYDVQVPFDAYTCINYLTYELTPDEVLARLVETVREALDRAVAVIDDSHCKWAERAGHPRPMPAPTPRVFTYSELKRRAAQKSGDEVVDAALEPLLSDVTMDARARSAEAVRLLWNLTGESGPGAAVYYSPPFYPHARGADSSPLISAARRVAEVHGQVVRRYYPYISDASYLNLEYSKPLDALTENMPLWSPTPEPGRYTLPLDDIRQLNLDVVNIGVWGFGAHRREERVYVPYSCREVPLMVLETILEVLGAERE